MTIEEAEPHSIVPILYLAPGATHAPHHVPPESPARYAGHFEELQRLLLIEAGKFNVFPLDDRRYERFTAELAGRPSSSRARHRACTQECG